MSHVYGACAKVSNRRPRVRVYCEAWARSSIWLSRPACDKIDACHIPVRGGSPYDPSQEPMFIWSAAQKISFLTHWQNISLFGTY